MIETDQPQLVEVLPRDEYEAEHLPGAISIPLAEMDKDRVAELHPNRTVVTYCYDLQCDLSSRAATLLTWFGFRDVVDYAESKVAWLAAGLPVVESRRTDWW